jgi:predicted RNA binding protein YcfA (HicA-like mRNA interferase family)
MADAEKLLSRMRASKSGWGEKDLESLYLGFGFQVREGSKHRIYSHPKYPQLYATVARHTSLAIGYVSTAVKLIDQLEKLESSNE